MHRSGHRRFSAFSRRVRWKRMWRRAAVATASVAAVAPVFEPAPTATAVQASQAAAPAPPEGEVRTIVATAYCLDGTMANGESVHDGAAAMRGVPLGTTVSILDGPDAGRSFVVKDRPTKSGILDIWMDDCSAARQHGARLVRIEVKA
jgi:3D (Asp-Asp-Asp) domain-containing protein